MDQQIEICNWTDIGCPGYLGKHRDEKYVAWDEQYGKNNWRLMWIWGQMYIDFLGVCAIYEDAYYEFLSRHEDILSMLIADACEIYDDQPSNIFSGFDYTNQETNRTHIQDIAIRRCLRRMGQNFVGNQFMRIRQEKGNHKLSILLSPGNVPFHKKMFIVNPQITPKWWKPNSVESFYQSNRVLQLKIINKNSRFFVTSESMNEMSEIPSEFIKIIARNNWELSHMPS
ncbi:MAG: hypothetical protein PHW50_02540 [Patescibacteria group bacterium]|nr:hypothetical protein [Patescibacteria group bacterium]